jgi:hypothetical protein
MINKKDNHDAIQIQKLRLTKPFGTPPIGVPAGLEPASLPGRVRGSCWTCQVFGILSGYGN